MGKSTTYQWPFSMSQTVSLPEGFMVFNILNMEQELFSSFDSRFEVEQWNQKREILLSRIKIQISQDIPRKSCRDKPSLFIKTFDVKVHPSIGKYGSFQTCLPLEGKDRKVLEVPVVTFRLISVLPCTLLYSNMAGWRIRQECIHCKCR